MSLKPLIRDIYDPVNEQYMSNSTLKRTSEESIIYYVVGINYYLYLEI